MRRWQFIVYDDGHTFTFTCSGATYLEAQYQAMLAYPNAETLLVAE